MKVVIMIGSFKMGGAERMSINTGEALIRKGHDVYYILQKPIFDIPNSIPKDRIIILRPEKRSDLYYKITSLFIGVYRKTRVIKPDVIIAFSRFSSFLACFTFHKKIFARFDMNPFELNLKQRIWATCVVHFPFVRKIVVPSTGMLTALRKAKPAFSDKFHVIPNSIDDSFVLQRAASETSPYTFDYIVGMGRLSHQKNFEMLISAFALSRLRTKLKLIIIGHGLLKSKLENLITTLDVGDRIILTGQMPNPFPVVAGAKFLINTSARESFCNVILEGLTLSVPVVATDCPYGPADMIRNNFNGFLIENNNQTQLVETLNRIADDDPILITLKDNACSSMEAFKLDKVIEKWEELIR